MFQHFFKGKEKHQHEKAKTQHVEAYDDSFNCVLVQYEVPALRACLDYGIFKKLELQNSEQSKCQEFLEKIAKRGNKLGIIGQVSKNENQEYRAIFTHQSFAEYFASVWLEKNLEKLRLIKEDFFNDKCQNLRLIFDIRLAEDCPLHLVALYKIPEQVEKYIKQSAKKDRRNRTALHVTCSYLEKITLTSRDEKATLRDLDILRTILRVINPDILFENDKLFEWNCLDYAIQTQSLFLFEVVLEKYDENVDYLFEYFEASELLNHCSQLGYSHLLKALIHEKSSIIKKFGGSLICKSVREAVETNQEYFKEKYLETIKILATNGCDVNQRDNDGKTVLHLCCQKGDADLVKILLKNGSDINAVTNNNETVLHIASCNSKPEIVEYLINEGMLVNQGDIDNWTPLHFACRNSSNCDVVETLLRNGADINAVTNNDETVLHLASRNSKPEIVEYLINKGMLVNQGDIDNWTPLHFACRMTSNCDVIKTLLRNGADINAVTNNDETVLHLASRNSKPEIVEYLINQGMLVNQEDLDNWTPLHFACRNSSNCDVIKTLLRNGADINSVTNNNDTVLHLASRNSKPEIVEYLIKNEKTLVNQVDINNWTPLHYACRNSSNCDVIKTLLRNGAHINAVTINNETVLHLASSNSKPEIVEYLLTERGSVNAQDKNKRAPLYYACTTRNFDIVEILLKNKADLDPDSRNSLIRNFHTILYEGKVQITLSLLKKCKKKEIDEAITTLPSLFPIHLVKKNGEIQPTLLLKMIIHINKFRSKNGSSTEIENKLYEYLSEKFINVTKNEMKELNSMLKG